MEEQDKRILHVLQTDGRISNQDLAERTAMSPSACWRRVRAMEKSGVIARHVTLVNARKVGMEFHAMVHVRLSRHGRENIRAFITKVESRDEVLDCFATTGEADYSLRVLCRNLDAYNEFMDEFLFDLPGVANVQTNVVLKLIKHETAIRLR